jgi:serine protease Do
MKKLFSLGCFFVFTVIISGVVGFTGGFLSFRLSDQKGADNIQDILTQDVKVINEDSAVIDVAENSSKSVVSIVITQQVPIYQRYWSNPFLNDELDQETKEVETGAGTGFIVSSNGLIITNRHVVEDEDASYTVFLSDGTQKSANVIARDTLLDIAFLDIEGEDYIPLPLGSSSNIKIGQRVISIGNALGLYGNTVSTGIVSGLSRDIEARSQNSFRTERLTDLIQTDASINLGNSGGPLLDIEGNVIGVNVAIAKNAENIGFAIPIDSVKQLLESIQNSGKIERPMLGVRYILVNDNIKKNYELTVDYGALLISSTEGRAILNDSPASRAGLKDGDVILKVDGVEINSSNRLEMIIQNYKINDTVKLKILRDNQELEIDVTLDRSI